MPDAALALYSHRGTTAIQRLVEYAPSTGGEHMRSMTRLPADFKMYPQFLREAESAGRLNHPNIISIYDAGEDGAVAYLMILRNEKGESLGVLSLLMPPGATIRTAGGTPAITSLPTSGSRGIPIEFQAAIAHVSADITRNTVFRAGTTYVITTEVHVTAGTTLTIDGGSRSLFRASARHARTPRR